MKPGSNTKEGYLYHDVPGIETPSQRGGSENRAKAIADAIPVGGKTVADLGCSAGGISIWLAKMGANVWGYDYDEEMIAVAKKAAKINEVRARFQCMNIDSNFIFHADKKDIYLWLSHWMWFVKQHGLEEGLNALYEISLKAKNLVFETSTTDGRAPLPKELGVKTQEDVAGMLKKYTCYQEIVAGPKDGDWNNRILYFCKDPLFEWRRHRHTTVMRKTYDTVTKINEGEYDQLFAWEAAVIEKLQKYPYAPKLVSHGDYFVTMSYEGERIKFLSDADLNGILKMLREENITHRDISPHNLVWNGKNAVLVDYAWADCNGLNDLPTPQNLGEEFKAPHGFDDEWSLRKVQEILGKE